MIQVFTKLNYQSYCDTIASFDESIKQIINRYGYPSFVGRTPDFEGLVRIILEQQVSLASAFAVYKKMKNIIDPFTPEGLICLKDNDFKSCGFSRQKTQYARGLAKEILDNRLCLDALLNMPDETVREKLISIKGIGNWTCDIYLLMCLNRLDIFPMGDMALIKAMVENKLVRQRPLKTEVQKKTEQYKPFRSIFAMIMWHSYLTRRNIKVG